MIDLKRYKIIDIRRKEEKQDPKEYTFEEIMDIFKPDGNMEGAPMEWGNVKSIADIEAYYILLTDGVEFPYIIKEV